MLAFPGCLSAYLLSTGAWQMDRRPTRRGTVVGLTNRPTVLAEEPQRKQKVLLKCLDSYFVKLDLRSSHHFNHCCYCFGYLKPLGGGELGRSRCSIIALATKQEQSYRTTQRFNLKPAVIYAIVSSDSLLLHIRIVSATVAHRRRWWQQHQELKRGCMCMCMHVYLVICCSFFFLLFCLLLFTIWLFFCFKPSDRDTRNSVCAHSFLYFLCQDFIWTTYDCYLRGSSSVFCIAPSMFIGHDQCYCNTHLDTIEPSV